MYQNIKMERIKKFYKLIKNDNKILTEEMTDIILEYYILYMRFLYKTKVKLSNIKQILYFIINRLHLEYTIYVDLKSEDFKMFEKFVNILSRNNMC